MDNERIDLTQYDERIAMANDPYTSLNSPDEDGEDIEVLVAELKRCYEEIDALNSSYARQLKIVWRLHDSVCKSLEETLIAWDAEKQANASEEK